MRRDYLDSVKFSGWSKHMTHGWSLFKKWHFLPSSPTLMMSACASDGLHFTRSFVPSISLVAILLTNDRSEDAWPDQSVLYSRWCLEWKLVLRGHTGSTSSDHSHTVRWSNLDRLDPKMGVFLQSTEATRCGHVLKWKLTPENPPADTTFMAAMAMVLPWKITDDFQCFFVKIRNFDPHFKYMYLARKWV